MSKLNQCRAYQLSSAQEMLAAIQSGQIDGEITDLIVNLLKRRTDVRIAAISLGLTLEGRFAILLPLSPPW